MRASLLTLALLLIACSGAPSAPPPRPLVETPRESILRIGRVWEAREETTGFRTRPSPVASFRTQSVSRLTLEPRPEREQRTIIEHFTLHDGRQASCEGSLEREVDVAYGHKGGEPALELTWASARLERRCDTPGLPLPELELPEGVARFVLRADQLVASEPPGEKRAFIPLQ